MHDPSLQHASAFYPEPPASHEMPLHYGRVQWAALQTIIQKEWQRILRLWIQTLLPPVVTFVLYCVIFGHLMGTRIGNISGVPYLMFLMPGLIAMAMITQSYGNVVSSFYGARFQRHVEELLVAPISCHVMILGHVSGGMLRGILVGMLVLAMSFAFAPLSIAHPYLMVAVMVLTTLLFGMLGMVNAIFSESFDDITIIPTFILTPLTYLGGVFYTSTALPPFWQKLTMWNPIFYIVDAFRYSLLDIHHISVYHAVFILVGCNIAVYLGLVGLFHRGIGLKK